MKASKLQHRVTRTRIFGSKLLEFGRFLRPLWIRRVLVRAQKGQWPVQSHRPFSLGLGLTAASPGGAMPRVKTLGLFVVSSFSACVLSGSNQGGQQKSDRSSASV